MGLPCCKNGDEPRIGGQAVRAVAAALAALWFFPAAPASANLTITPTFESSITSDPNSALIEASINSAINIYQTLFTDPITVSIDFRYATTRPNGTALPSGVLATSNFSLFSQTYNTFTGALTADAKTANDAIAIAHLPAASAFPNAPLRITPTSANGRAVGLNTPGIMDSTSAVNTGGTFDGIVTLNSSQPFQFTRTGGIASNKFDALQVIQHEMNEVLGLGSVLPSTTDYTGNTAIMPEDLFRYSGPGAISLTSSSTASSFISIDGGTTKIVAFNQTSPGDFGDWGASPVPLVQLAFVSPGTQSDVSATSPEGVALDVIGYDLVPGTPEPASLTLLAAGGLLASCYGWLRRRRGAARGSDG